MPEHWSDHIDRLAEIGLNRDKAEVIVAVVHKVTESMATTDDVERRLNDADGKSDLRFEAIKAEMRADRQQLLVEQQKMLVEQQKGHSRILIAIFALFVAIAGVFVRLWLY